MLVFVLFYSTFSRTAKHTIYIVRIIYDIKELNPVLYCTHHDNTEMITYN